MPELPLIPSHLGILQDFAVIVNSADTGYEKPHPEAFKQMIEALREPQFVWTIGDSYESDIAGAQAMGIPGIPVRTYDPRAERCCDDLRGVIALVQEAPRCSLQCRRSAGDEA